MEEINYVGQKLDDVKNIPDLYWRISKLDGVPQMLFRNHSPERYNFDIENGVIVKQKLG